VAIQGDHPGDSMLFSRPGKEPLGGCNVTPFAQEKVDGSTLLIDGAVQVDPLTPNPDISLVHPPGVAHRPCVMIPALFKLRDILLHPPQDRRMSQWDAALGHHLDQVTGAQLKRQVPPHAQHDDFVVKMTALEKFPCRGRFLHTGRYRREPSFSSLHQNPPMAASLKLLPGSTV